MILSLRGRPSRCCREAEGQFGHWAPKSGITGPGCCAWFSYTAWRRPTTRAIKTTGPDLLSPGSHADDSTCRLLPKSDSPRLTSSCIQECVVNSFLATRSRRRRNFARKWDAFWPGRNLRKHRQAARPMPRIKSYRKQAVSLFLVRCDFFAHALELTGLQARDVLVKFWRHMLSRSLLRCLTGMNNLNLSFHCLIVPPNTCIRTSRAGICCWGMGTTSTCLHPSIWSRAAEDSSCICRIGCC
jgi:hypothetical protein